MLVLSLAWMIPAFNSTAVQVFAKVWVVDPFVFSKEKFRMNISRMVRLPLLTLALLASLVFASGASASAPVVTKKAVQKTFSSYHGMSGGGCPNADMAYSASDD